MSGELVEVWLAENDRDVTSLARARQLVTLLLGSPRETEQVVGSPGAFLVAFTDDELAELEANGWFGRDLGTIGLSAEWPG